MAYGVGYGAVYVVDKHVQKHGMYWRFVFINDIGLIFSRLQRSGSQDPQQRGCAPLAQSAERFHGKEKVDSSILSGGSVVCWGPCTLCERQ